MDKPKEKFPFMSILYAIGVLYLSMIPVNYYFKISIFVIIGIVIARNLFYSKEVNEGTKYEKSRTDKINGGIITLLTIFITINL